MRIRYGILAAAVLGLIPCVWYLWPDEGMYWYAKLTEWQDVDDAVMDSCKDRDGWAVHAGTKVYCRDPETGALRWSLEVGRREEDP